MKWINFLKNYKSSYYIYKLNPNDSVIIFNKKQNQNEFIIVLYGSLYVIKTFSNRKVIPIVILRKRHIFNNTHNSNEFYSKLVALEKTYILKIKINKQKIYSNTNKELIENIINSYKHTVATYECMNEAIRQKYTRTKILHIMLSFLLNFGVVKKKQIYLPFKLSQKNLAFIIGTREETISKIIKDINRRWKIRYFSKRAIQIKTLFNFTVK